MSAPQDDPWENVETFISDICLPDGDLIDVDVCLRTKVDAARAADAARHQADTSRLTRQAQDISHILREAGCGAMPLVDGVRWLVDFDQRLRDEVATLRATVEQQAARITALEQALKQVLRFQYEHRGMGTYACRSCGAQAQLDEWVGIQRREACSPSCPWGVARQALETP